MHSESEKSIDKQFDVENALFSNRVLAWYDKHGRSHLPWQQEPSLYKTWISEIMLQQTQVKTVIPYFERFIARFPNIETLAEASQDAVLSHWSGLGYYARARNMHHAAKIIRDEFDSEFPRNYDAVLALPGIGRSTAGAILSLALNLRYPMLDGNVKRVLTRHQMISGHPSIKKTENILWKLAEALTPFKRNRDYTQAMMDLGALVCTRTNPACVKCPVSLNCQARINNVIKDYPNKKPKKSKPTRNTFMPIVIHNNHVLMEKRNENGIWGGLFALPMCATEKQVVDEFGNKGKKQSDLTHVFTHFNLIISPRIIHLKTEQTLKHYYWLSKDELEQVGLPKPVKSLLELYFDANL